MRNEYDAHQALADRAAALAALRALDEQRRQQRQREVLAEGRAQLSRVTLCALASLAVLWIVI